MAKSLSAVTKLKIARSLKGNKNAFKGGPKARLSTRQKIANINAATKAKKANLSSDQIARRQAVAKRLRAQARREEALGGGQATKMVTNEQNLANAREQATRKAIKELEQITGRGVPKRADNAAYEAMKKSAQRQPSQAKVQPKAKQNLNAPQSPPEQRAAALSPAQRRRQQRSKFEADQAKARSSQLQTDSKGSIVQRAGGNSTTADVVKAYEQKRQSASGVKPDSGDNIVVPGSRKAARGKDPLRELHKQMAADDRKTQTLAKRAEAAQNAYERARERRRANPKTNRIESVAEGRARSKATEARRALEAHKMEVNARRNQPQPPRSDTGTDRSGTFTKKIEVNDGHNTRSQGRKAIETEEDLQDLIAERTPDIIRKLAKGIPQSDLNDLKAIIGKEMGSEGLDALNDILKGR